MWSKFVSKISILPNFPSWIPSNTITTPPVDATQKDSDSCDETDELSTVKSDDVKCEVCDLETCSCATQLPPGTPVIPLDADDNFEDVEDVDVEMTKSSSAAKNVDMETSPSKKARNHFDQVSALSCVPAEIFASLKALMGGVSADINQVQFSS